MAAIVNRILIFFYGAAQEVVIIISFPISLCPRAIIPALYLSPVVPDCFIAIIKRPPRIFEFLGVLFSCMCTNCLRSNSLLISSEMASRLPLQVHEKCHRDLVSRFTLGLIFLGF